ncbi:restriction endonuclease subunit S [Acinetobacter sp. Ver3]|uniref:restriction endonuclease subunit S n=1 Tax=Acinetobacter sp. Ver3 TaxID=466088 RepID=UPI000447E988|nr:restriction endonuclease subunit S [Acinetobacter sp. Ver3]EZQ01076.1 hypothetical protein CL42_15570 [Acinetobacter sp. Ver3]
MSTDLNMEYQEVKFGEIAKHISKRIEPSETTLEIYVGLEHLDPDSLKITRHGVPSDVAGQKLLVKKGQIIFGKRRAYQRKIAVADWDCICSAHAMVLEAIPGKILPEFLPFFMQSNQFMERAVEISEGSLSPTIKWKVLEIQKFKLPTIENQKTILKGLEGIEKVSNASKENAKSCLVYLQRLVDYFTTYDRQETLPEGWTRKKLKSICSANAGKLTLEDTDRIKYIDISAVSFPGRLENTQDFILSDAPGRARRQVFKNNVLISNVRPNHRATLLINSDEDNLVASTGFTVLSCDNAKLSKLIFYFTLSKKMGHILSLLAVGTSFPAVTSEDILIQEITIPNDLSLAIKILDKAYDLYLQYESQTHFYLDLKKSYLAKI